MSPVASNNNKRELEPPKEAGIPCLPGYQLPSSLKAKAYNKLHTLDYCNGYAVSRSLGTPRQVSEQDEQQVRDLLEKTNDQLRFGSRPKHYLHHEKEEKFAPVVLDDVVFRFEGFFKDEYIKDNRGPYPGAIDSDVQDHAIRYVIVSYFMEDDSISVVEPPVKNSGLPQGVLLKRQRIPKPQETFIGAPVNYYTISDFFVGKSINFYGRDYQITGCDKYTENYIKDVLKLPLVSTNPAARIPSDPYLKARSQHQQSATASHHREEAVNDRLRRFIEEDRKVLRFYCAWDDRQSYQGELHFCIVHYFLFDETAEAREIHAPNCGRDPFPVLVRRQKIPRQVRGLEDLATTTPLGADHDVKNMHAKDRFITWRDFKIGSVVNFFGRPFLVYDVDGFTRDFYLNHGVSAQDLQPISKPMTYAQQHQQASTGTHTTSHEPNQTDISEFLNDPPRRPNMFRMLQNGGKVLRFAASLQTDHEDDKTRTFMLSYRLADDTMAIVEHPNKRLGILGGKFMERGTPKNPSTGKFYDPCDLYVGAALKMYGRVFVLNQADDFTFKWMEDHADEFPKSNVQLIQSQLAPYQQELQRVFAQSNQMNQPQFVQTLLTAVPTLSRHEAVVLARKYATTQSPDVVNIDAFLRA